MFDWQAELAPHDIPVVIATSGNSIVVAIFPDLTHTVSSAPIATLVSAAIAKPTFAQALRGPLPTAEPLPLPSIHVDSLSISISTTACFRGLDYCKTNLRGRLVLSKGDKPYATKDITAKLHKLWKIGPWHMASLGRGFYEFFFASQEDMCTVWAVGTINLKPGVLQLFE